VLTEANDRARDEERRSALARALRNDAQRAFNCSLLRERCGINEGRGLLRVAAVRHERVRDRLDLPRAGVTGYRAAKAGKPIPIHFRQRVRFAFVSSNEREHVARFRVRDRHARVRRPADGGRHTGHDFERDPLLVQEQGFLAAAVEHKRIAPFQPDDDLAFPCLFRDQKADRVLLERLGSCGPDIDPFRIGPCATQQSRVHAMIVDHDVRGFEIPQTPDRDERRIARPGTHDVNGRITHSPDIVDSLRSADLVQDPSRTGARELAREHRAQPLRIVRRTSFVPPDDALPVG
jgi:hypothetical protein